VRLFFNNLFIELTHFYFRVLDGNFSVAVSAKGHDYFDCIHPLVISPDALLILDLKDPEYGFLQYAIVRFPTSEGKFKKISVNGQKVKMYQDGNNDVNYFFYKEKTLSLHYLSDKIMLQIA
jgi:hypothetical protein